MLPQSLVMRDCGFILIKKFNVTFHGSDFTLFIESAIIIVTFNGYTNYKGGGRMVKDMGMTNKQFQGFIRLALGWLEKALEESPDNKSLQVLKDIFQSMLEDD